MGDSNYPDSLDDTTTLPDAATLASGTLATVPHSRGDGIRDSAIIALETVVGIPGSTDPGSHDARIVGLEAAPPGGVQTVNGDAGPDVVLGPGDVGADVAGAAATAQSNAESFATAAIVALGLGTASTHAAGDFDAAGAAASAFAAAVAVSQPLDSDLTAIAALTTTAFGRGLLTLADAAALRSAAVLGTAAQNNTGDFDAAGAAASAQAAAIAASQPVDSDLTAIAALTTTAFGRSVLTQADAAAVRTLAGLGTAATHASTDFDSSGAAAAAQAASQPLDSDLTAIAALTTTAYGRAFLGLADAAAARTALALGTAATSNTTAFDASGAAAAAQAASQPLDSDLTAIAALATTAFGRGLLILADAAALRSSAGLGGAAVLNVGTTAGTVAAGDDSRIAGAAQKASNLSDLANEATARTNLGLAIGTDVEAHDADLTTIAALTPSNDDIIQRKTGAWTNRTMAQLAADLGIPASLNVLLGSIDIPRRSLDRFRGAPNRIGTNLTSNINSTVTTITVDNVRATRVGCYEVIGISSGGVIEQMQVIRGQRTANLTVIRGVNGTTAASHTAGDPIIYDRVRNVTCIGDSTCEGVNTGIAGSQWDGWVRRTRRIFNERFGGSLGWGFRGIYRGPRTGSKVYEWDTAGLTVGNLDHSVYFLGPWIVYFGSGTGSNLTWTRPADCLVGQIDVWWVECSAFGGTAGQGWSYSTDGGSTWIDNPVARSFPTAATTLNSADNNRRCDYFDGTKTMTLASVTGLPNSGFVIVNVGSAGTFKCVAQFTYDGISGSTLTNVQYVGPAAYNALTTVTGDTVQARPEMRKTSITITDPATFKIRMASASGTASTCSTPGIDVWNMPNVYGTTAGVKVHNFGYAQQFLHNFLNARTIADAGTTNANATLNAARGAFTSDDVGKLIVGANIPANTCITAQAGTSCTLSNNATGTVTAGAANNPVTVQGGYGDPFRTLHGSPMSLMPDLIVHGCWTNDMGLEAAINGAYTLGTATLAIGSPTLTMATGTLETLDAGALIAISAGIMPGTTISTYTDTTHAAMSANATANETGLAVTICTADAVVNQGIKHCLDTFYAAVNPFADQLLIVPFEQGTIRLGTLNPVSSTAAFQATYRQALDDWATTNRVATLDIYKAWSAEGNVGFAAANADGLMDTLDTSGYHEGGVGYADMASRFTRLLEFT
jgi:hypothetical protein